MKKTDTGLKFIYQFQNYYRLKLDKKQYENELNQLIAHSANYQILPQELVDAGIYYQRVKRHYNQKPLAAPADISLKKHKLIEIQQCNRHYNHCDQQFRDTRRILQETMSILLDNGYDFCDLTELVTGSRTNNLIRNILKQAYTRCTTVSQHEERDLLLTYAKTEFNLTLYRLSQLTGLSISRISRIINRTSIYPVTYDISLEECEKKLQTYNPPNTS